MSKAQAQKHRAVSFVTDENTQSPEQDSSGDFLYGSNRMNLYIYILLVVATLFLTACQTTGKTSWQYYDECSLRHEAFSEMVLCGKETRAIGCAENNTCSARGNALVQYADSLVTSIKAGEISEPEARRQWLEYRTAEENAYTEDLNAQRARRAAAINSMPNTPPKQTTCIGTSMSVNCTTY